jgi:hypothetical protein
MTKKRISFFCYLFVFQLFSYLNFAQERGDVNLKPYKEDLKKAKEGNLKAALLIAQVCKAHPLESGLYKDYKKALEWYQKALLDKTDTLAQAPKGLFEMYMTGGYGILKDISLARKYHQLMVQQAAPSAMVKIYTDKKNIDLREFFIVFDSLKISKNPDLRLKMARMYWEFGINPMAALDSTSNLATIMPDALYLDEKWRLEAKSYFEKHTTAIAENTLYNLIEKHILMGSNLARSEWAAKASAETENSRFFLKPDEMQRLLASYTEPDVEMQFKMKLILQKYQKGVQHYATLRNLYALVPKIDSINKQMGKTAIQEFIDFENDIKTIADLAEEMRENPSIKLFDLQEEDYDKNFDGYIRPLLKLRQNLQKPEVLTLVGEENMANYMTELNKKIRPVFDNIDKSKKMIEFKKAYDEDTWLSYFKNELDTLVACRLKDFEINASNINFYYEMLLADDIKFKSLAEGKQYLYNLQSKITDPFYRAKIAAYLKEKIIQDVIGKEPTKEQIENLQKTVDNETWLQPEGREKWFAYTSDSKNWFSGSLQRGNIYYAYTVIKQTGGEKYDLTIKAVANEKSTLAYASQIKINESNKGEYTITIAFAKYLNYGWSFFENDYLRVIYKHHEPLISAAPVGANMANAADKNHGKTSSIVLSKVMPADFSEKTAIRTAVSYLIWEYTRAFAK